MISTSASILSRWDRHSRMRPCVLFALEHQFGVLDEQGLDAGQITQQALVGRYLPQGHLSLCDEVREAPGELLEGRTVARRGQCVGGARSHLSDAAEAPDPVVAGRDVGIAEVEQVELVQPPGARRFGVHAHHQIGVALGVDDDHDLACVDVLGRQQLQQPGLAHPGGAQHQHVPVACRLAQQHRHLARLHAVQQRGSPQVHPRRHRVPERGGRGDRRRRADHRAEVAARPAARRLVGPGFKAPGRRHQGESFALRAAGSPPPPVPWRRSCAACAAGPTRSLARDRGAPGTPGCGAAPSA